MQWILLIVLHLIYLNGRPFRMLNIERDIYGSPTLTVSIIMWHYLHFFVLFWRCDECEPAF